MKRETEWSSIKLFKRRLMYPLCSGEYRNSQILLIFDGIFSNASVILTMGIFLSGYIIFLKGSDFLVGILNNSANWALIVALFSFFLYERMARRKKLLIALNIASRLLVCSIVFLPLIPVKHSFILGAVTMMVITGYILWGIYSIGFTVWLIDISPRELRSKYIYTRMLFLRISFTVATIVMGFLLDWFNKSYTGFLIVFATSMLLSLVDILILLNVKEPPHEVNRKAGNKLASFLEPLKNKDYRGFLLFVFLFYISLMMSSSFTPLYLIRYLKFDYGFISTITVIQYILMITCTKLWGWVEERRDIKFVLKITPIFAILEVLIYSFLRKETFYLLFIASIISGIGYSGFNIAVFTYRYDIMPENNRTIYEGWFGAAYGMSMLLSPVIGNAVMKRLPVIHNSIYQHSSFQLLYLISFIFGGCVIASRFCNPRRIMGRVSGSIKKESW